MKSTYLSEKHFICCKRRFYLEMFDYSAAYPISNTWRVTCFSKKIKKNKWNTYIWCDSSREGRHGGREQTEKIKYLIIENV